MYALILIILFQDFSVNGSLEGKDEKETEIAQESVLCTDIHRLQGELESFLYLGKSDGLLKNESKDWSVTLAIRRGYSNSE